MSISLELPAKFVVLTRIAVKSKIDQLQAEEASEMTDAEREAWEDENDYGNDLMIYQMIYEELSKALEARRGGL
ncbi:MAG: hypothetical protein NXH78_03625 [Hyphomonadaceae bacterium]|nr:hypothetical protein [Hyphomonadaceae bacterium]